MTKTQLKKAALCKKLYRERKSALGLCNMNGCSRRRVNKQHCEKHRRLQAAAALKWQRTH